VHAEPERGFVLTLLFLFLFSCSSSRLISLVSTHQIKSQNILLVGYESSTHDKLSTAKVADFGTVRADDRNKSDMLRTSAQTHAFTQRVVGTTPYMPAEVRAPAFPLFVDK
jgi:hypothetical protein